MHNIIPELISAIRFVSIIYLFQLLLQSNFIDESSSGLYSIIGGGSRVFHKICALIDDEMRQIGAHKIVLPSLSHHKPWMTSGEWTVSTLNENTILYRYRTRCSRKVHNLLSLLCLHFMTEDITFNMNSFVEIIKTEYKKSVMFVQSYK